MPGYGVESVQVSGRRHSPVLLTFSIIYSSLLETEICSTLLGTSAVWSLCPAFLRQVIGCPVGGFCDLTKSHRDAGADP